MSALFVYGDPESSEPTPTSNAQEEQRGAIMSVLQSRMWIPNKPSKIPKSTRSSKNIWWNKHFKPRLKQLHSLIIDHIRVCKYVIELRSIFTGFNHRRIYFHMNNPPYLVSTPYKWMEWMFCNVLVIYNIYTQEQKKRKKEAEILRYMFKCI